MGDHKRANGAIEIEGGWCRVRSISGRYNETPDRWGEPGGRNYHTSTSHLRRCVGSL